MNLLLGGSVRDIMGGIFAFLNDSSPTQLVKSVLFYIPPA